MLEFILINLLLGSLFLGQTIKIGLPFISNATITPLDLMVIIIFIVSLVRLILVKGIGNYFKKLFSPPWVYLIVFLLLGLISLILNASTYSTRDSIVALAYWVRFVLIILSVSSFDIKDKDRFKKTLVVWASVILAAGFVQYVILPDFSFMTIYGWDPHQSRMLSTFYDPNYLGAFFALVMSLIVSLTNNLNKKYYIPLLILFWIGLFLTFSRSAWLIGAIAVPLAIWPKSWKLSVLSFLIFIIVLLIPNRLSNRVYQSGSFFAALFNRPASTSVVPQNQDPSAGSRGISMRRAWELGKKNWLKGVGYNAYSAGLVRDKVVEEPPTGMSSQGSDSSILNVFATSGIFGLVAFLLFWGHLLLIGHKGWKQSTDTFLFSYGGAVIIGSFFNNLLFYVLLIVPLYLLAFTSSKSNAK